MPGAASRGGTDLVVGARQGKAPLPESIVAIHRLDGLRGIEESDGALRLGALDPPSSPRTPLFASG